MSFSTYATATSGKPQPSEAIPSGKPQTSEPTASGKPQTSQGRTWGSPPLPKLQLSKDEEIEKLRNELEKKNGELEAAKKETTELRDRLKVLGSPLIESLRILAKSVDEAKIFPVGVELNYTKKILPKEFLEEKIDTKVDIHISRLMESYGDTIKAVEEELKRGNEVSKKWNLASLQLAGLIQQVRWTCNTQSYPSIIHVLASKVEKLKESVQKLSNTEFLKLDATTLKKLEEDYKIVLEEFKKLESEQEKLVQDKMFIPFFPLVQGFIDGKDEDLKTKMFAIQHDTTTEEFKLKPFQYIKSEGWVREEWIKQIEHQKACYGLIQEKIAQGWVFIFIEMTRAKNMLEWLRFTMMFIIPIQELQIKSAKLFSQVNTAITASKASTAQTKQANNADLTSKFTQLLSTFRACLKDKQNIQGDRERFNLILGKNTEELLEGLSAVQEELQVFIPQKFLNNGEVDSLKSQIKAREVLLSTDLAAGWQEIAISMPEVARLLDYIEDAVVNREGIFGYEGFFNRSMKSTYRDEEKKPIEQIPLDGSLVSKLDGSLVVLERRGPPSDAEVAAIPVVELVLDKSH